MKFETKCIQAGYSPKSGEPRVLPIVQSTTYKYDDAKTMGDLFNFDIAGHFYTRLSNPTLEAVENKIAQPEGGIGAMLTSSGQAASLAAVTNLCGAGDHMVCNSAIYGGTFNLFNTQLRKLGLEITFVSPDVTEDELNAAVRPNTKLIFSETLTNASLAVLDIEMFARVAHQNGLPLIVDNTFPTPALCRPFEWGADIITHSTSKYMDGHAVALGGAVVDGGSFDFANSARHPDFNTPDESYHGLVYTEKFGKAAYIAKARAQGMRDMGYQQSPQNAFLLNIGLETLFLRMERHTANAMAVAVHLENHPKIGWVNYPGLKSSRYYERAQKYLSGTSGVLCFGIKGGFDAACAFMEKLKLITPVVHVADSRSGVLHPASTTHRQLSAEQLVACGITADTIRLSVGIEHIDDIIEDIEQAL